MIMMEMKIIMIMIILLIQNFFHIYFVVPYNHTRPNH